MAFLGLVLAIPPGAAGKEEWTFWHARDHADIRAGIQAFGSGNLPSYILNPVAPWGVDVWETVHQQAHNDANAALNLRGSDLSDADWKSTPEEDEWLFLNFQEHVAMHQAIGI